MLRSVTSESYRLLHPKVVCFLTSVDNSGKANIMPCAWVSPASEEPPMVIAFVAKTHYTARLIKMTKQFGLSIPDASMEKAIWVTGSVSGKDVDKFAKAGLQQLQAKKIKVPMVAGCIGYLECTLVKVVDAGECYGFLGVVETAYADNEAWQNKLWVESRSPVLHLGGKKLVTFKG